jgi:formylglycine-generating enzyme required for sulfatase activity
VPPVRAPWPRAWTLGIAAALVLLVVGGVLYNLWINSAPALIEQARAALNQGDEAAAEQALERATQQDPVPVLAFVKDRAALYRALAERAGASGESQKAVLAQTEAQRWQEKAVSLAAALPPAAQANAGVDSQLPLQDPVGDIAETLVTVPGGTFQMGCSPGDGECDDDERPVHEVKVAPFRIGKYEVTQAQWQGVMGENPSSFQGEDRPVESVSWDDIQGFLERLNAANPGKRYRLPTEAEWEYAARAGTKTPYWWGASIGQGNANCNGCGSQWDNQETAPVGSFKPNAFGLYDTAGNVWEWVQDCWHEGYAGAPADGSEWRGACIDARRVLRGGSWTSGSRYLRVSTRGRINPDYRNYYFGLRLAQDL